MARQQLTRIATCSPPIACLTAAALFADKHGIRSRKGRQPVTPTDGAGAVPAGGGSSLPLWAVQASTRRHYDRRARCFA